MVDVPKGALNHRVRSDLDGQGIPGTEMGASGATTAAAFVDRNLPLRDRDRPKPAEMVLHAGTASYAPVLFDDDMNSRYPGIPEREVLGDPGDAVAENPRIFFPFRHGHVTRAGVLIKQLRFHSFESGRFPPA